MQNRRGWIQEIQYFRAIAVIEVIVWHSILFIEGTDLPVFSLQKGLVLVVAAITQFAVPHFVFISGVVLYNKYSNGFSLSIFYKKRFRSVVPPYLVWSTFYYFYPLVILTLYTALCGPTTYGSNLNLSLRGYVAGLVVGNNHLWFVVLIIQLYLLYPLLVRMYNRFCKKNPVYVLSLLLLVQEAFGLFRLTAFPNDVFYVYSRAFFLSGIFYFVFGFFIADHYETLKQKFTQISLKMVSLVVVLSTMCYAALFYHTSSIWTRPSVSTVWSSPYIWLDMMIGPFYCLLLIIFYLRITSEWGEPEGFFTRYLEKIGEDSFGIYLVHLFFIVTFAAAITMVGINYDNLLFYPTLAFLTLILSYWSVQALYRLPFSAIIIGKPRKKQQLPT